MTSEKLLTGQALLDYGKSTMAHEIFYWLVSLVRSQSFKAVKQEMTTEGWALATLTTPATDQLVYTMS